MDSLDAYTDFASVYDTFMDEIPYEEWAQFLDELIREYGVSRIHGQETGKGAASKEGADDTKKDPCSTARAEDVKQEMLDSERNLVLDLGCGTGTLTELLYQKGYDMIGVDCSQDMLRIAMEKKAASGSEILYLCQDMRELDLYSTVGTVVSVCDSVNYLLEDEEVEETFRLVNNYLYPGGLFIFDFNTVYKYEQVIGDATIAENREDCSFIWENYYHEKERINEYDLTVFVKEGKQGMSGEFSEEEEFPDGFANKQELFRKFTENHYQRGYTLDEMKAFVKRAGMKFVKAIDADTHQEPDGKSERIYIIAKEWEKCNE